MAGLLNVKDTNDASQIAQSNQRIVELNEAVSRIEKHEESAFNNSSTSTEWTDTYKYWDGWEDVEVLRAEMSSEKDRLEALLDKNTNPMGHCHSHTEERKMFEQPEKDKMAFCERHRLLGNFLYGEGVLPKAAEQYKTALSYYDYCFPEEPSEQLRLEEVRHASLCNLSLCYRQMGFGKEAVELASQAIRDSKDRRNHFSSEVVGKAHYRRAQALRLLDDYDLALEDLREAEQLLGSAERASVVREAQAVQAQKKAYMESSKAMAKKMLSAKKQLREEREQHEEPHEEIRGHEHHPVTNVLTPSTTPPISLSCLNINMPLEPKCI